MDQIPQQTVSVQRVISQQSISERTMQSITSPLLLGLSFAFFGMIVCLNSVAGS